MRLMTAGEARAVPVALSHQSSPDKRGFFENHPPSLSLASKKGLVTEKAFLPHPSSPARRGSPSPSAPPPQERAPTGKPAVLYSQTSSRPVGVARDY